MFNLIRKDFLIHYKMLIGLLFALVAYVLLDRSFILIGITFSMAISMHIFAHDEKSSIKILLSSLPYTRKEIVSSKYISTLIFTLLVLAALTLGNLLVYQELPVWRNLVLVLDSVLVMISVIFPFSYKYKSQYLLIASIIFFVIYLFVFKFVVNHLIDELPTFIATMILMDSMQLVLTSSLIIIGLYALSWLLSIRIYSRKVF